MDEQEALRLLAETIRGADDSADLVEVATFGGGGNGLPGIRVEHATGARFFLVLDLTGLVSPR